MTKEEFKLKYKKFYDSYNAKLIDCHNTSIETITNPMPYFVNYLKFMRDYYLLTTPQEDDSEETNITISSLMTAIELYDKYIGCEIMLKNPELKEDDIKKLQESKQYLLDRFWKLIATNMEVWLPDVA